VNIAVENDKNLAKLKENLIDVLDIEDDFEPTDHFIEDLGLSSLMALEVMVELEKEYEVKFKEEEMANLTSLENVYEALKSKNANFS